MINSLNESQLHKALKTFYAVQFSAKEEVQVDRWICDLVCPDKSVIEIQNKSVSSLKEKITGLLKLGKKVTIVHPIIRQKTIQTYSKDGELLSSRKSPKKESLYSELREFTGLAELLLDKKLSFICPEITMAEKRLALDQAEQSKNGRRRYKKAWQKVDKALLTISGTYKLSGKKDWLGLLPQKILKEGKEISFTSASAKEAFVAEGKKEAAPHANLVLWLLRKAGLIVRVPGPGRGYHYLLAK